MNILTPIQSTKSLFKEGQTMGQLLEIVTPLHQATQRDYLARMQDDKVHCMEVAKEYEKDY